jgi:hypothetical protein
MGDREKSRSGDRKMGGWGKEHIGRQGDRVMGRKI